MKFVSFRSATTTRIGVLDGDAVIDLNALRPDIPADLTKALASGADLVAAGEGA
ncbi:5-oxopent-3-ene-1,2,5-tricarboxylate decarboxylase, partial [Azospirillum sp. TSH100]